MQQITVCLICFCVTVTFVPFSFAANVYNLHMQKHRRRRRRAALNDGSHCPSFQCRSQTEVPFRGFRGHLHIFASELENSAEKL